MEQDPRRAIRGWVQAMQRFGITPPDDVRKAALPRSPIGSFGGWAARPAPPVATPMPPPPKPRWQGIPPNAPRFGPGVERAAGAGQAAANALGERSQRRFPVRNPPEGYR